MGLPCTGRVPICQKANFASLGCCPVGRGSRFLLISSDLPQLLIVECNWNFAYLEPNKTGTSQVGAISKAQKAQTFWNCKRGGPFGFFEKKEKSKNKNFEPVS